MAKLARKTQKIFASGSAQNQVTSFGSIKAGAVNYTKDVNDIQTAAFEGGWSDAVQDDYAPYRQDRNGVDYVTTSQLAYVFQEGLPEYDANTTYYKGSWVKGLDGDSLAIYESLKDDNIGNNLTDEESWEAKSFGGGLEIGDIGIAPLGIDESQNKRRYLNGQVISQAQFASFTAKLKKAVELHPSLATTEEEWQQIVTGSKGSQCGKFVIDDALGTIRLPKVKDISGLQNLSNLGTLMNQSAPNITGEFGAQGARPAHITSGAFYGAESWNSGIGTGSGGVGGKFKFSAANSSSTYGANGDILHQEAVQYPYFIQVATGVEESIDVSKEIQLNNPFSLLDYKWSEYAVDNASWLISNGAFRSGVTYKSVYNLLVKIKNGQETKAGVSVKWATEAYTDTDFVLNGNDTTFRLPIKVKGASSKAVVGNGMSLGLTDSITTAGLAANVDEGMRLFASQYGYGVATGTLPGSIGGQAAAGNIGITTDPTKSGIETSSQGMYLYFYVGETIQDANIINAAGVLNRVATLSDSYITGLGMPDYSAGVSIVLNPSTPYVAQFTGLVKAVSKSSIEMYVNGQEAYYAGVAGGTQAWAATAFVSKGDIVTVDTSTVRAVIYPLKGVKSQSEQGGVV